MRTRVPLAAGTVLGRYRILRLAGEGGMGDVYEAFDDSLERTVALKRVRGGPAEDNRLERFRREALALAQLNHPGLCQVFELAQTDRGAFIAMEWVEGRTLSDRLLDGPLPWREAAELLRQIAEALAAAHAKGIVHRDLKPGNVMLTPGGQAKVLDFGLARFAESPEEPPPTTGETPRLEAPPNLDPTLDPGDAETLAAPPRPSGPQSPRSGSGRSLTLVGSFMGTLGYTSPEQALARSVGPPTDVFNLGILALELVTAQRPFPGQGRDALDAVVDGHRLPLPRRAAPKGYRALVDRLLAPKPQHRPTAEEAAAAFAALVAPRGALWWTGVGAASVAVLAFGGYWLFGRGVLAGLVKGRPARVAVMGFRNDTGQPMLTAQTELGLADLLAAILRHSPRLQVIDSDSLAQAGRALRINPAEATPAEQLRLAKALGADLLLTGAVSRHGALDRLDYRLTDRSGRLRTGGEAESPSVSDLVIAATQLAEKAGGRVMSAVDPLAKNHGTLSSPIPPEAVDAYALGVQASRRGHYSEAEPLLAKAAFSAPEWDTAVVAYASALRNLARPGTGQAIEWALVAARRNGSAHAETSVLELLGNDALDRHDMPAAEHYLEEALAQAQAHADPAAAAFCLNGLGRAAGSRGDAPAAERKYREALDAAGQAGDLIIQTQINTNLGNLALERGDLPEASRRYGSAIQASRTMGYEFGEAVGLNNLGIVQLMSFHVVEARSNLEESLRIREKNGDARGVISCLRNLGLCAQMEDRLEAARASFERSLALASAIPDPFAQGQARFYLAELDRRAGRLPKALAGYRASLLESQAARDRTREGQELAGASECLIRMGRAREAAGTLAQAKGLIPGNPYLLRALTWEALSRRDKAAAQACLDEAILDPRHDAPEIQAELKALRDRFRSRPAMPSSGHPSTLTQE